MMDNRQIIGKLRDCAKGLLDVARELQRTERVESPRTLEIVKRQGKSRAGGAHEFDLQFVVGVDDSGNNVVLELARLPHVLIGGATGQGAYVSDAEMSELVSSAVEKYGVPKYAEDEK